MAQRARERRRARGELRVGDPEDRVILEAQWAAEREQYWVEYLKEHPESASPVAPDDDTCRECYEWRADDPGVYLWHGTCDLFGQGCDHAHHDHVWFAAAQ
jgi:hypothetical protein